MWIVLEGVGCSGKTTLANHIKEARPDIKVLLFPRYTGIGAMLRSYLAGDHHLTKALIPLFFADFTDAYEHEIEPAMKAGQHVVCDRWFFSTFVYQREYFRRGEELDDLFSMARMLLPRAPDRILLLQPSPEEILRRLRERGANQDRYDDGDLQRLKMYQGRYQELLNSDQINRDRVIIYEDQWTPETLLSSFLHLL